MKKFLSLFHPLEWIYLIIAFATLITLGILYSISFLEIFSTLLGIIAASLNVKGKKYAFFFYAAYVLVYGIVSLMSKIYGEGIFNLGYNLPLYLWTIYQLYLSKKTKNVETKIPQLKWQYYLIFLGGIIVVTGLYGWILTLMKSEFSYLTALGTSFALIASFLASRRYKEQWYFWMAYSVVLIIVWFLKFNQTGSNGITYFMLNIFYVGINIYGLILWHKRYKVERKEEL